MRYDFCLFDADDTLLDFKAEQLIAFRATFRQYGYPYHEQEMLRVYNQINHRLWAAFEKGEIRKQDIIDRRFQELFDHFGINGDSRPFSVSYQDNLGLLGGIAEPGAMELIRALAGRTRLFVVTNGMKDTQEQRMRRSGLAPYFEEMFISDTLGVRKPEKGFFDIVFSRISGFEPQHALLIGDSLSSDMAGGENAGIDTCWYNKLGERNTGAVPVTYEVKKLADILPIVTGQAKDAAEA